MVHCGLLCFVIGSGVFLWIVSWMILWGVLGLWFLIVIVVVQRLVLVFIVWGTLVWYGALFDYGCEWGLSIDGILTRGGYCSGYG